MHALDHADAQGNGNLGKHLLDSFLERFLLFLGYLVASFHQAGDDISRLEVKVYPLRLLFQKLPELYPEEGDLFVNPLEGTGFLQLQFLCFIEGLTIEGT